MIFTLAELAELTGSTVKGDDNTQLKGVASLDKAKTGDISFVSNPRYKKTLAHSNASAIILSPVLADSYSGNALINSDPYLTFAKIVNTFYAENKPVASVHPSAVIAESADIGESVSIAANVVIESGVVIKNGVTIGANCYIGENSLLESAVVLHPNVTLYSETEIGSYSSIHSGAVIGADGFGYAPQKDKSWYKILQVGNVVIGSHVEVGANTTIDRAALGSTEIEDGVKLDNQIQVGHNVKIGEHSIFAGGTVLAGSTVFGKRCQIGGAVAVAGHLQIADDVIITGRSMVIKSITQAGVYSSGITADKNINWRRNAARFRKLDGMAKTIKQLEKKLEAYEKREQSHG